MREVKRKLRRIRGNLAIEDWKSTKEDELFDGDDGKDDEDEKTDLKVEETAEREYNEEELMELMQQR